MRPSDISTWRRIRDAMCRSCVMITTAVPPPPTSSEQVEDALAGRRIEGSGRLVGEQHRRLAHQRAGDRDALLLAARELHRADAPTRSHSPTRSQRIAARCEPLAAGHARVQQAERDVLERRERRQQEELLEHEPDAPGPQRGALALAQRRDVRALDAHDAAARVVERAHDREHRALARAGRSDDRDELTRRRSSGRCRAARAGGAVVLHDAASSIDRRRASLRPPPLRRPRRGRRPTICTRVSAMSPSSTGHAHDLRPTRTTSTA